MTNGKVGNVIRLKPDAFRDFLDDLEDAYKDKRLKTFICIAQTRYKQGEEQEGFNSELPTYWFGGESCVECLGLVEVMKAKILEYMANKNEE